MAAVAAASAELLIIGWYIFRVLLQVSIYPGFGWERAPETRPGTLSPYRDCRPYPTHPIPIAAIPVYQNAAVVLFVPARSVPTSSHRPCPQCARAQPGTKTQGCGGRPLRTIATNAVRNTRYTQARSPEGGGALVCCETLQLAQQKIFTLKNCAMREIFFKINDIYTYNTWVVRKKLENGTSQEK